MEMSKHVPSDIETDKIVKMSLEEMKDSVIRNANLFYSGKSTELSDFVYDACIKLILEKEPTFNVYEHITYDGIRVMHDEGIFRDYTKKADISEIDYDEYIKEYIPMIKYDGSSVVVYYNKDGTLNKIVSRGDDESGILQTKKLRGKVPDKVSDGIRILFGEAVCRKYDTDGTVLGRGKANGIINSKYLQEDVDKYLHIKFWDILYWDGTRKPYVDNKITSKEVFESIRDKASYYDEELKFEIPCDGIVGYPINGSDVIDIHKLYYSEAKETTLETVEWVTAPNSGVINPKAIYKQVILDDTKCTKATLNNFQYVLDNNVYPGMKVKVAKCNLTIPQILEFIDQDTNKCSKYLENLTCPECGGRIKRYGNKDIICAELNCSWWQYLFFCRFFGSGILTESEETMIWETEYRDFKSIKQVLTSEKLFNIFKSDLMKLVNYYSIPRISSAKKNAVIDKLNEFEFTNLFEMIDSFTESCDFVFGDTSLTHEYVSLYSEKLKQYLKNI